VGSKEKKVFSSQICQGLPGQEIRWINHDTKNHRLVPGNPDILISDGVFDTGEILAGQASSIRFNTSKRTKSITYFCFLYPNERGTVIILPMEEDSLTKSIYGC